MWWISRSVYALTVAFPSEEVICEDWVFMLGVWHTAQPIELNNDLPLLMEVAPPGVVVEAIGGARRRMNCANPSRSLRIAEPAAPKLVIAAGGPAGAGGGQPAG